MTHLFVIGAGYVGLVSAVGFARLGHRVTVADIDARRIDALRAGRAPLFEPGLEDAFHELADHLDFTTDLQPPADVRWSFVAVGTPTGPDGPLSLDHVRAAVGDLIGRVGADHTIVVRSTLPMAGPDALLDIRRAAAGGSAGGPGSSGGPAIVTNPEFMREGSALRDFAKPGRIAAGWLEERDRDAAAGVLELYRGIDAPTFLGDARSVALVKLASNVFLAMKVAYANELARLSDAFGADVRLVADGVGLDDRIGRAFLDAGPGYGGSCLPEQAVALAAMARAANVPAPLIGAVAPANGTHQRAIVERLGALLPDGLAGARVALLGLAFKANTDDVRESPALALAAALRSAGATVIATDPRAGEKARAMDPAIELAPSPIDAANSADAVLIATEWSDYRELDWHAVGAAMRGDLVYDTRAIADPDAVTAAGLRLERLGRR